ncbi:uncharacterized protein MONOS_10370 [Monocercomonoides exilis]|uniref:uncharacterized protein n=1 Tax=Monocercomonoides exilis TaxID=2049356 RepID=UPI00355A422F|nr:hypothetical protein MONOS_10370 [Monocercomonoides exilis]|eukprot:MONOS_10370.1-p1 / transcript=MONOS_10370.1 / gene=MONOS_10370 / organism=Monocercomonoides_exilis_PA203 / gene_product=unspecified product / transcript_product=unspecified product / location=Mono_scaffold00468:34515-36058(+) / protein_length=415 / sequence_SO=supercontig / SO=protein_coding / is_pseudo=false
MELNAEQLTERFSKSLNELECRDEYEQKQKIEEINRMLDEMDEEELEYILSDELFDEMYQMIEEKKLSFENAILLLKHIGYINVLKNLWLLCFVNSSLQERFETMIIEKNENKKEENEKLLIDLCECYLMLCNYLSNSLFSICIPCLFKVALLKEVNEETQKEVEIALYSISCAHIWNKAEKELYLDEIKEIIQYHQEHHNLTQLAYQSAWRFLINRFIDDRSLESLIIYELNFVREASRELEELAKWLEWRGEKEEKENRRIEKKEAIIIKRWFDSLDRYLVSCKLRNEEYSELIGSIVQVFKATKVNYGKICCWCIILSKRAAENRAVKVDDLLKSGAVDVFLEEIQQPTLNDKIVRELLAFFVAIERRLKGEDDDEMEEPKEKKLKRKVSEIMEEEGYEDCVTGLNYFAGK